MTDIKNVVSLEIANQLKEAGWVKETEFYWTYSMMDEPKIEHNPQPFRNCLESWTVLPAPLATEILEELPYSIEVKDETYNLEVHKIDSGYVVRYQRDSGLYPGDIQQYDKYSLPNALAKMWLYLKKEKLI